MKDLPKEMVARYRRAGIALIKRLQRPGEAVHVDNRLCVLGIRRGALIPLMRF